MANEGAANPQGEGWTRGGTEMTSSGSHDFRELKYPGSNDGIAYQFNYRALPLFWLSRERDERDFLLSLFWCRQ